MLTELSTTQMMSTGRCSVFASSTAVAHAASGSKELSPRPSKLRPPSSPGGPPSISALPPAPPAPPVPVPPPVTAGGVGVAPSFEAAHA
jgi:hypothetical protein